MNDVAAELNPTSATLDALNSLEALLPRLPVLAEPDIARLPVAVEPAAPVDARLLPDILQWDVRSWLPALRFWDGAVAWSRVGNCLELGARQGGLSLWLANKGKQVVCSDLSGVHHTASSCHSKYNLRGLVKYQDIDATCIPYENHFDLIVFKSMLGGLGHVHGLRGQQIALEQMWKALKPGGQLLFAENLTASPVHQFARRKAVEWANAWRYITIPEMRGFLEPFEDFRLRTSGVLATFGRSERQRRLLAHVDRGLLNFVTPNGWKYIVYGVATK